MPEKFLEATSVLPRRIAAALGRLPAQTMAHISEIRLRAERPVCLTGAGKTLFLQSDGQVASHLPKFVLEKKNDPFSKNSFKKTSKEAFQFAPSDEKTEANGLAFILQTEIEETFRRLCEFSVHSFQRDICEGFVTMRGGHRVGLCGKAVVQDREILSIREISSLNIRIAREFPGAADEILLRLGAFEGAIVAGPPGCGKTTILRDMARHLSLGKCGEMSRVVVVDERGELAGANAGVSGFNLGLADVMTGYPKAVGILQAVRTLGPQVVVCDEVGTDVEAKSISEGLFSGVRFVASAHAGSAAELLCKRQSRTLLETGAFDKVVMLRGCDRPGHVREILTVKELMKTTKTTDVVRFRPA